MTAPPTPLLWAAVIISVWFGCLFFVILMWATASTLARTIKKRRLQKRLDKFRREIEEHKNVDASDPEEG